MTDVTLVDVNNGDTTSADIYNQYVNALSTDILPRNSSGVVTPGAGDLGSPVVEWNSIIAKEFTVGSITVSPDVKTSTINISNGECLKATYAGTIFPVTAGTTCTTLLIAHYSLITDGTPFSISLVAKNVITAGTEASVVLKTVEVATMPYQVENYGICNMAITTNAGACSSSIISLASGTYDFYLYCYAKDVSCTADIDIFIREIG